MRLASTRAGKTIRLPEGYEAFLPATLPPAPAIHSDPALLELLSRASLELGRLDGAAQNLPNAELFVWMHVRREALLSSQIEGTQASLAEVLELEAKILDPSKPTDADEVVNYLDALLHGLDRLADGPISTALIRELHVRLLAGTRGANKEPGRFRSNQNWIGVAGSTLQTATFVPPPPGEIEPAIEALLSFLSEDNTLPTLMQIGLAHAQFETIHPFRDGNGRIGRLLITLLLCRQGLLKRPILYLSYYLRLNRAEYYDRLQSVRERGDWEGWLRFFLVGVTSVAADATRLSQDIVALRERHRELIITGNARPSRHLQLLDRLYDHPVVTIRFVEEMLSITFPTASGLVQSLVRVGILGEISGRERDRIFGYREYLALLET